MSDFRLASQMGSGFARSVLAQLNPYAAMCNKMLKNVFQVRNDVSPNMYFKFKIISFSSGSGGGKGGGGEPVQGGAAPERIEREKIIGD